MLSSSWSSLAGRHALKLASGQSHMSTACSAAVIFMSQLTHVQGPQQGMQLRVRPPSLYSLWHPSRSSSQLPLNVRASKLAGVEVSRCWPCYASSYREMNVLNLPACARCGTQAAAAAGRPSTCAPASWQVWR